MRRRNMIHNYCTYYYYYYYYSVARILNSVTNIIVTSCIIFLLLVSRLSMCVKLYFIRLHIVVLN